MGENHSGRNLKQQAHHTHSEQLREVNSHTHTHLLAQTSPPHTQFGAHCQGMMLPTVGSAGELVPHRHAQRPTLEAIIPQGDPSQVVILDCIRLALKAEQHSNKLLIWKYIQKVRKITCTNMLHL